MRFTTLLLLLVICGLFLAGASWGAANYRVADLLGAPPPKMGKSKTSFDYHGVAALPGHPRAWIFEYGPTSIPGASKVRIYVDPSAHILRTEPAQLAELLNTFHNRDN